MSDPIQNPKSKIQNSPNPRVLVVGGSGNVGRMVLPFLAERFALRIFDRVPPPDAPPLPPAQREDRERGPGGESHPLLTKEGEGGRLQYIPGDVTDPDSLAAAMEGVDVLLYMVMASVKERGVAYAVSSFDVNVKGLYLALDAAVRAGVKRAVYTSTLSVYDGHLDIRSGATDREDAPPEPRSVYGFTKLLGEEVCGYFHRTHSLPVLILRLFMPMTQEQWRAHYRPDRANCHTSGPDLARALAAALAYEHDGFEIVHVTGDTTGRAYHHEKAKRLLGWEPLERPRKNPGD
jgi:nucleoside-diphosphate-sugar epimerase